MFNVVLGVVLSAAFYWLVIASVYKTVQWIRTPQVLPIPLTPAPRTRVGVIARLFVEFFGFRSLARSGKTTWLASLAFHYGLLFIVIMHIRFLTPILPSSLLPFIVYSGWAALVVLAGLLFLLLKRCLVDRLRYISAPSDYLHILLLLAITVSGLTLKRIWPTDLYQVGAFLRGALQISWQPSPDSVSFYIHVLLVIFLLVIFPVSKLMHGVGVIVSPSFNQVDSGARKPQVIERE